jgi:hypothetical protein
MFSSIRLPFSFSRPSGPRQLLLQNVKNTKPDRVAFLFGRPAVSTGKARRLKTPERMALLRRRRRAFSHHAYPKFRPERSLLFSILVKLSYKVA